VKPSAGSCVFLTAAIEEIMLRNRLLSYASILILSVVALAQAEPSTQPTAVEPATKPAAKESVPADAQVLLDQVAKAYGDAKALSFTGKLSLDFEAGEDAKHESTDFTASFVAPNQFRHEIKDEVLIVSTGEKLFAYLPGKNEYLQVDAPKERVASDKLSEPVAQLLGAQNPALLMTLTTDPIQLITGGASKIAKADDVKLAEKSFNAITFEKNDRGYRVLIDPSTHFIRQLRIDRKAEITKRGVEGVKTADVTFDYLSTKTDATPAAELFAWSPPKDATVAKEETESAGEAATALEGQPAPDFKLNGVDGTTIALADLRGSIVVLDFWATWCGPCVQSLPHIDQLNKDLSDKGVKVFAVNLEEPKAMVQKFIIAHKLSLPVLLDTDGATGKKYLASAIPETVVIGKDGVIKKVIVGFGGPEPLREAVDAEMKK